MTLYIEFKTRKWQETKENQITTHLWFFNRVKYVGGFIEKINDYKWIFNVKNTSTKIELCSYTMNEIFNNPPVGTVYTINDAIQGIWDYLEKEDNDVRKT